MRSNWMNGIERFKSLQQQARATRGDKDLLANELAEVKAKLEAGVGAASSTAEANVSNLLCFSRVETDFSFVSRSPKLRKINSSLKLRHWRRRNDDWKLSCEQSWPFERKRSRISNRKTAPSLLRETSSLLREMLRLPNRR